MLIELRVQNLGVVEDLALVFGTGMTVLTGETGAGKTMLVEALRLLAGGRGEAHIVRTGAKEAFVEARFAIGDEERVIARTVPSSGRSRAYLDGRMASTGVLEEEGAKLVDLHAQHAHQRLLVPTAQRDELDDFGAIDTDRLRELRRESRLIDSELEKLGGDATARARELDLLRFQLDEIARAAIESDDEDDQLKIEEEALADASAHREAAGRVHEAIAGEGGAAEAFASAIKAAAARTPLTKLTERLMNLTAEADDLAREASDLADRLVDDAPRLVEVQERRRIITMLVRKYGPTIADVRSFAARTQDRHDELDRHDDVVAGLEQHRQQVAAELAAEETAVGDARRKAAPDLAAEVERHLHRLALPNARFMVEVPGDGAGDEVTFLLGPNPGMPLLPVAKAASGGELARTMLALRLALLGATADSGKPRSTPQTLVFDEVDAGIGGEAAVAVGQALAELGNAVGQVLVVTHLAQVAADAAHHVVVEKEQTADRTVARIRTLTLPEREVELARMLSGRPDSRSGRAHARELLATKTGRPTTPIEDVDEWVEVDLREATAAPNPEPRRTRSGR